MPLPERVATGCWFKQDTEKGNRREEMAYFISNRNESALVYGEVISNHSQIEHSLHWVKDETLKEDEAKNNNGQ